MKSNWFKGYCFLVTGLGVEKSFEVSSWFGLWVVGVLLSVWVVEMKKFLQTGELPE